MVRIRNARLIPPQYMKPVAFASLLTLQLPNVDTRPNAERARVSIGMHGASNCSGVGGGAWMEKAARRDMTWDGVDGGFGRGSNMHVAVAPS
jgi:hypothetical protein